MQKDLCNRFFVENKLFKWSSFTGACFLGKMVYKNSLYIVFAFLHLSGFSKILTFA